MMALKHVGRMTKSKQKVIVAYRVIPGEPENCLVIPTQGLDASQHDSIIGLVESNAGQTAYEFAEAMHRTQLPDGLNMLVGLHKYGKMQKVPTDAVEMTPDTKTSLTLAELNKVIAEQKGVTVADLAVKGPNGKTVQPVKEALTSDPVADYTATTNTDGVLSDEDLAAQYRSQADALFKEAKVLREQAEELVPTKKKTKVSAKEVQ
jgi:hypothetical protein